MDILTNPTQFTTYTPEQARDVNTVCSISSTGFAEYCPRECPRVFMDYVNDQGETVNGEFDNTFSIYSGLCNVSENVPMRGTFDSYMYSTTTYEWAGFASICQDGYEYAGVQACKPLPKEPTPMPVILPATRVEQPTTQAMVEQPQTQQAPLVRTGGDYTVLHVGIIFFCIGAVIGMLWDSLTNRK